MARYTISNYENLGTTYVFFMPKEHYILLAKPHYTSRVFCYIAQADRCVWANMNLAYNVETLQALPLSSVFDEGVVRASKIINVVELRSTYLESCYSILEGKTYLGLCTDMLKRKYSFLYGLEYEPLRDIAKQLKSGDEIVLLEKKDLKNLDIASTNVVFLNA